MGSEHIAVEVADGTQSEAAPEFNARGAKLNRRGRETRARVIATAVDLLVDAEQGGASANLVAKAAGVTWGAVQHQFGDADGLWAAVLAHLADGHEMLPGGASDDDTVRGRMSSIVEAVWQSLNTPHARAVAALRNSLPRETVELATAYPLTARQLTTWDRRWRHAHARAFRDLPVDQERLERVRDLILTAVRGLRDEARIITSIDVDEVRIGLIEATALYLERRD